MAMAGSEIKKVAKMKTALTVAAGNGQHDIRRRGSNVTKAFVPVRGHRAKIKSRAMVVTVIVCVRSLCVMIENPMMRPPVAAKRKSIRTKVNRTRFMIAGSSRRNYEQSTGLLKRL
jgi:hypothetical protein